MTFRPDHGHADLSGRLDHTINLVCILLLALLALLVPCVHETGVSLETGRGQGLVS